MADAAQDPRMTLEEFLLWEGEPDLRYELVNGSPVAMAPTSGVHATIAVNAAVEIDSRLASRPPCRATSEAGIAVDSGDYYLADIAATCEPPHGEAGVKDPFLVVEVLSPTTRLHDLGRKLDAYKALDGVREIWLVDSIRRWVQVWRRDGVTWRAQDHVGGGTFASPALEDEVEIARLYRNTGL